MNIKKYIIIFILFNILINYLSLSYKLERLNEDSDSWEDIEEDILKEENEDNSDDKVFFYKQIKVDRREHLYMRIQRDHYGKENSSTEIEPISVRFEIRSKDIQETFMLFGLNNDTSIKKIDPKDNVHSSTTPIRIESCFEENKPIYFSLSMFNYLWGGDLIFTIRENDSNLCNNTMEI